MKLSKAICSLTLLVFLIAALLALPAEGVADNLKADDSANKYNIYFRPAVRWGTNGRTLYIADFLIPLYQDDKNILFANPKFTPNDHDGWELNVGLGYRHLLLDDNLLLGLNAFYDRRRSDRGNYFEQWGMGAEIMADIPLKKMDLGLTGRFNFYYPTSHTRMEYGDGGFGAGGGYFFQNLGIYSPPEGDLLIEEPMRGLDYELGVRIPCLSDHVETWAYAGGYNYFGRYTEHVDGFMARLEVIPTDFLRLNFEYKYDNVNRDEFYGEVAVEVPFSIGNLVTGKNPFEGIGNRLSGSRDLKERMVEPVRRDVDIFIVKDSIETTDELVEEVVFVSETATPGAGDGTFENPYASITEAMADSRVLSGTCATIHVINDDPGAGTAGGGAVNIASMLVWGSGVNHPIYTSISNLTPGHPTLDGTLTIGGDAITAMGIEFNPTIGPAVGIDVTAGTGSIIDSNRFVGNGTGISVTGGTGTVITGSNSFGTIAPLVGTGILVNYGAGDSVDIDNLLFNVTGTAIEYRSGSYLNIGTGGSNTFVLGGAGDIGIELTGGTGVSIDGNIFGGTGIGILADSGGTTHGNIDGNTFSVTGSGISYIAGTGLNIGTTNPNTFNLNTSGDYGIYLSGGDSVTIQQNRFDGNGTGIYIGGGSTGTTVNNGNLFGTIVGLAGTGIYVDNPGVASGDIDGNTFSVTGTGIDYFAGTGLNIGTTTGNSFALGAGGCVGIDLSGGDNADIFGNTFTGTGIGISITGASDLTEIGDGTPANSNTFNVTGIGVDITDGTGTVIDNNIFTITGPAGVNITGGTAAWIDNNAFTITNSAGDALGIFYGVAGDIGAAGTPFYARDNTFTVTSTAAGSNSCGIYLNSNGNIFADITGNDMTGGIIGDGETWGIYIESLGGHIGSDGTTIDPVLIDNNSMTVTSNSLAAYGIRLVTSGIGNYDIFANIMNNSMTAGTGIMGAGAAGISLSSTDDIGGIGSGVNIMTNNMTVTGTSSGAYGIMLSADGDIFTGITLNNMTGGITGAADTVGIWLISGGSIGYDSATTTIVPVIVENNFMTVLSSGGPAAGIYLSSGFDLFAEVTDNNMTGGITGNGETWGIYLGSSNSNIGSDGTLIDPVLIENNSMTVTSNSLAAYGIRLVTSGIGDYDIFADIMSNNMRAGTGITGAGAAGISLSSTDDIGGIFANKVNIMNNSMAVTGTSSMGVGIMLSADDDIFANITTNIMSNGITGVSDTIGIWLTSGGSIGYDSATTLIDPVTINGNSMSVLSSTSAAAGIYLGSSYDLFADVTNNNMTGGITGDGETWGIYLGSSNTHIGSDGTTITPVLIDNNSMTVTSNSLNAYGINLNSNDNIFADITGNDMTGGITGGNDAWGIYLAPLGNIGSSANPVLIDNNLMTVTATSNNAGGVYLLSPGNIYADVTNNDMTGGVTGNINAFGIYIESAVGLGSSGNPFLVDGNLMTVTATNNDAYGILLLTPNSIFADISNNDIVGGVTGGAEAYGIYLNADGSIFGSVTNNDMTGGNGIRGGSNAYGIYSKSIGDLGSAGNSFLVDGNLMTVTATNNNAYGIYLIAGDFVSGNFSNIFADITNNNMTGGITGGNNAFGIFASSLGCIFADISNNDITGGVTGGVDAYGIYTGGVGAVGYDGITIDPVQIDSNTMTVTATSGDAYGILTGSWGYVFADITNNDMTTGITGANDAYGIYFDSLFGNIGSDGTTIDPALADGNSMTVTATNSNAYGIYFRAGNPSLSTPQGDIFADITNNDLTGGITGGSNAYGIYLESIIDLGSAASPLLIDNNLMTVAATNSDAYGIFLSAGDFASGTVGDIFADITNNDMTGGNGIRGVSNAYGIYSKSIGDLGSAGNSFLVDGNLMTVTATNNDAYGIHLIAGDFVSGNFSNIFVDITNNNMTGGVTGGNDAYGIFAFSLGYIFADISNNDITGGVTGGVDAYGIYAGGVGAVGYDGTTIDPVQIDSNTMTVTATSGDAYGIYTGAWGYVFADITNNDMTGGITGANDAYGITFSSWLGNIGSDGTTVDPALADGNSMTVTATNNNAYGIYFKAGDPRVSTPQGDIFADITNNDMTTGITGGNDAYGIYLESVVDLGSAASPLLIDNNLMTVAATNNDAYGIHLIAGDFISGTVGNIFADITNNNMTGGITGSNDAYGIYTGAWGCVFADVSNNDITGGVTGGIRAYGIYVGGVGALGYDGTTIDPVQIDSNTMTVTATSGDAYGILAGSWGYVFADITNNDMTTGITGGNDAYGIISSSWVGNIGSDGTTIDPVVVGINSMTVTATNNDAYGIYFVTTGTDSNIFAEIIGNNMTGGITGDNYAYGINLSAVGDIGSDGTTIDPVLVGSNSMTVTSTGNDAYGIHLFSYYDIFADIIFNTSVNVTADANAWGGYLSTYNGVIGNSTVSTNFLLNDGTIDGNLNRYMLGLYTDVPGTGSNVNWGGTLFNTFTPLDGGVGANWTGNYDMGDSLPAPGGVNKPVDTDFGVGDTLSP